MSLFYRLAYAVGFTPWEADEARQASRVARWFDREEAGRSPPFGQALDLGCGTGTQVVALARRGWRAIGVERERRAAARARARVEAAGVGATAQILEGDVTALRTAGVAGPVELILDFGCFHGLGDAERQAVGREIAAVAHPGARLLIVAFAPGFRGPLPRGASEAEIVAALKGWRVVAREEVESSLPPPLRHGPVQCYRLLFDVPH